MAACPLCPEAPSPPWQWWLFYPRFDVRWDMATLVLGTAASGL